MRQFSEAQITTNDRETLLQSAALLISALCTLCIVAWMLWYVRFGIDFADEGYYLNWISNPHKYSTSVTQFGFVYHPLYVLLDGNIALIRQANVLITFGLGWMTAFLLMDGLYREFRLDLPVKLVASAAIAVSAFCFYRNWLPTPNYNFLTFQSLLLVTAGLFAIEKTGGLKSLLGWSMVGIGGWLALMAKPPAAAAVGVLAFCYLAFAGKLKKTGLAISLALFALLIVLFAFVVDGSLTTYLSRMQDRVRMMPLLSPGYGPSKLFRLDGFHLLGDAQIALMLSTAALGGMLACSFRKARGALAAWALAYLGAAIFIVWMSWYSEQGLLQNQLWIHLVILAAPYGALLATIFSRDVRSGLKDRLHSNRATLALLIALPWAFAFGTGGNYWFYYGLASIFWVMAGLLLFTPVHARKIALPLLSYAIVVQALVPFIVLVAMEDPYYQPNSLRRSAYEIAFGKDSSRLFLPPSFGTYLQEAKNAALAAGFRPGMPMIDLTGRSPGLLYALGASSTGYPWLYGNYVNSNFTADAYAVELLKLVPCRELAEAWVLTEPDGPVSLSAAVLARFGFDMAKDYQVAGAVMTVPSLGGFPAVHHQYILKPTNPSEAIKQCMQAKPESGRASPGAVTSP